MIRALKILLKSLSSLLVLPVFAAAITSLSPIYDFPAPQPFNGPDIFDPYSSCDSSTVWKRANFHTHTRVNGLFNECEFWPDYVDSRYRGFGYDIITFSNHNRLTVHPSDTTLQVNVYEHGYNLFKYHKLVFGSDKVCRFDHLLPFLASQRQFQMDMLGETADFIQLNHPFRTNFTSRSTMERLSGYRLIELDSGVTTEQDYWDWALSAGHYSFALANDDLHFPDRSDRFAVRCNFLDCPSGRYNDLKSTLLSGAFYCMRVPDYGNGDWAEKEERNRHLPRVSYLRAEGDTVCLRLSAPASEIKAFGQNHTVLAKVEGSDEMRYVMTQSDSYVRLTAYFDDGAVIYTNPFARFDSSVSDTPYVEPEHTVNWLLTLLFNGLLLAAAFCCAVLVRWIWKRGR